MPSSPNRRPNPQLVKIHRSYTVEEIATLFGVHRNTVRNWIDRGLKTVDAHRPYLILGRDLRSFLVERRRKSKSPCPPGFLYCLKCRAPRRPAGGMIDYIPMSETGGNLRAICSHCETLMHRRVARHRLREVCADLEVTITEARPRIDDGERHPVNCDSEEGDRIHENA